MSKAEPDSVGDVSGKANPTASISQLAQENIQLRTELEEAQALILRLRTENNRLASERNHAMLEKSKKTSPVPTLGDSIRVSRSFFACIYFAYYVLFYLNVSKAKESISQRRSCYHFCPKESTPRNDSESSSNGRRGTH